MSKRKPDTPSLSSFSNCEAENTAENLLNEQQSSNTERNGLEVSEQGRNRPMESTSAILQCERATTFMDTEKPLAEHTTVGSCCSSSKKARNASAEQREMSSLVSASPEIHVKLETVGNYRMRDSEVSDSSPNEMDSACLSSPYGQQLFPSVRRSKRVSTMACKEMEKYFEGCLVMILREGFPVTAGMMRKPDEDPVNQTHVGSGHDEYICEENGVFYFYVQIFEEPITVKRFTTGNLELFDAGFEPVGYIYHPNSHLVASYLNGMKIANAASKYSVEERLRKFNLRVGTSIGNLLAEIENVTSQPTTTLPRLPSNTVTVQSRDEAIDMVNGESSAVSVVRVKNLVIDTRRKLRETEEANKSLKTENLKLGEKIDELEAAVRELKRQLDSTSSTSTTVLTLQENFKLKDSALKAQEKVVSQLRVENSELQENLEKEREENRECQKKLEKMRSEFQQLEELLEDEVNEGGP